MKLVYEMILPVAPTINSYYGARGNTRYIKPEGQEFRWAVAQAVRAAKMPKLSGRLSVFIRVFPRDKRVQDLDNRCKSTLDALQVAGAFDNDSQIDDLRIVRDLVVPGGRMEVLIGEL